MEIGTGGNWLDSVCLCIVHSSNPLAKINHTAQQVIRDLTDAVKQYVEKRDHFVGLCKLYGTKVVQWTAMDRSPHLDPKLKCTVLSVYSHNNKKAPTLKALVDWLMSSKDTITICSGDVKVGAVVSWLQEGLAIFQIQVRIHCQAKTCQSSPSKELLSRRTKLSTRIDKWRKEQKRFMYFSASDQQKFRLLGLASRQAQMLELALGDIINSLQTTVKTLTAAYKQKIKHACGQDANTRSNQEIRNIEAKRSTFIVNYALFRDALDALDALDKEKWPTLSEQDTFRKARERRQSPGNSRVVEGNRWAMTRAGYRLSDNGTTSCLIFGNGESESPHNEEKVNDLDDLMFDVEALNCAGTKMAMRKAQAPNPPTVAKASESDEHTPVSSKNSMERPPSEGWIWKTGQLKNMKPEEIEAWEETNDRVQWFRAEADFERWQECLKRKHAECDRALRRFAFKRDAWALLAKEFAESPGHGAYAREHRDIFESLRVDLQMKFDSVAVPILRPTSPSETIADRVLIWRTDHEKWASRPPFKDPTIRGGDTREPLADEDEEDVENTGTKRKSSRS
ncbi:hypothetical protein BT96DRAFT_1003160 [Gymnopus androsaceus JB14]|uniref:Uncharacterized protein n=1 Tax=Gymnopus androsaceus JB14 TaxID=1447944 RepID=A0A6A4GUU5_9AGAR|nr:hypothetical protein BT96DRAFT_1003160 [Gymnopus androsaceus JB14]